MPLALTLIPISETLPSLSSQPPASRDAASELPVTRPDSSVAGQIIAMGRNSSIDVHYAPTGVSRTLGKLRPGDRVTVLDQKISRDGEPWYEIRSTIPSRNMQGWVRSSAIDIESETAEIGSIPRSPEARSDNRGNRVARRQPAQLNQRYDQADLDYFLEIATRSEFTRGNLPIRKWEEDIKIQIHGTPTPEDRQTLNAVIEELRNLVGDINIQVVQGATDGNVDLYFVDPADFSRYIPQRDVGRGGVAWVKTSRNSIYEATVLVASSGLTQQQRNHIIREEITQSLGLLNDSFTYRDSIFFQLWNAVTQYSERDERVIRMLYLPEVRPGMSRDQVLTVLRSSVS
ncbi:MAG: DUF2927 domain-containing protein [Elainellaceae cyanobacterium]